MLPDFVAGSYKRYKQDTALFTTWLAKAASAVGYSPNGTKHQQAQKPEPKPELEVPATTQSTARKGARLKGKARKVAKDAAESSKLPNAETSGSPISPAVMYTITTRDLLRQAEAVAQFYMNFGISMPANLRGVVQRAIRARQRCSEWFCKSGVSNHYADKQHTYFTSILEQSMRILEPCMEPTRLDPKQGNFSRGPDETTVPFTEHLSSLELEESSNIETADVSEVADTVNIPIQTTSSKVQDEDVVYELELESGSDQELAFIIFCFFEDLHRTQDYLNELWRKYKAKTCDLHTAAITTNAAFDLVRQAEEDLIAQAPTVFNTKRSYDSIAIIVFYADAFQQGVCPEARLTDTESLRITPFDDFIFLSTARILMKFTYVANTPASITIPYPLPCLPLKVRYMSQPALLGTPAMDKKEDSSLSMYIIERRLWNSYKNLWSEKDVGPPLDDEFSRSLDKLLEQGSISVALVFEARIFLDIQEIMGDEVCRGYQDLLRSTTRIDKIINLKMNNKGTWMVGGSFESWNREQDRDVVARIKQTSIYWILKHPANEFTRFKEFQLAQKSLQRTPSQRRVSGYHNLQANVDPSDPEYHKLLKEQLIEKGALPDKGILDIGTLKIRLMSQSTDPNFLFNTNPIYCGLVSFNILTDFEIAGVSLANEHKSIWPIAHIYNALQQSSGISRHWPEMNELIDMHTCALFADEIPLSPHEFYVRFALASGSLISSIPRSARNRPLSSYQRFQQDAKGMQFKTTESSSVFRQYFEKKSSLAVSLLKLDKIMRHPGPKASKKAREAWKRPLSNQQFLIVLETNLVEINRRLRIDYVTLTRQCAKLLYKTRGRILLRAGLCYDLVSSKDRAEHTPTRVVLGILKQNSDLDVQGSSIGPRLRAAKEKIERFLTIYRPQNLVSHFNALSRPAQLPSAPGPNHWNISIRHVALPPPGDLVFFVQPDNNAAQCKGPIQDVQGQIPGHVLNPKSLATLQTIACLIMEAFVDGNAALAPWSWATNDPDFARRIIRVMTDMGVRQDLMSMTVADADELATCDAAWDVVLDRAKGPSP
ncbi:MAG: hypothetical protein Q9169_003982 [Polycauliona sp. 2 TL-2023]